jgi:hypothetical protein
MYDRGERCSRRSSELLADCDRQCVRIRQRANKVTRDGAATISGTFNVARTYSVTVEWATRAVVLPQRLNGMWRGYLEKWSYRRVVGRVAAPGLNYVNGQFLGSNRTEPEGSAKLHRAGAESARVADLHDDFRHAIRRLGSLTNDGAVQLHPGHSRTRSVDLKDPNGKPLESQCVESALANFVSDEWGDVFSKYDSGDQW